MPDPVAADYNEAALVLPYSQKASAALSRRCLQHVLRNHVGVKPGDLQKDLQQVIDGQSVPHYIADSLDAVRNIGNFAAHPMKSKVTGEIADVEPEEASWLLATLEQLFQFVFVGPARAAEKKKALNDKLAELGKPAVNQARSR